MATFRPYTTEELRAAAEAYGLDPDFVEAVYAAESSRGTNPRAMTARPVKRKRDTTIVRGPFQLEDDTTADLIRRHKLGNVNVDDPDVHLDLALRLMQDLQRQYGGDYAKMAKAYLGGPGGVTNSSAKDELGTSTGAYSNRILAEMAALKGRSAPTSMAGAPGPMTADQMDALLMPQLTSPTVSPFQFGASAEPDLFGVGGSSGMLGEGATWADLAAANRDDNEFMLPGAGPAMPSNDADLTRWIAQLVDEELAGKEFAYG